MKLFLTSAGITNPTLANALLKLTAKPFSQANLAFIPTAANVEVGDKSWLINDYQNFQKLGLNSIDIVDISALPQKMWLPRIRSADILAFGGGNTFHLIYWLRKSGLDKLLPKLLKTKVYLGISAGSMIVSKSIFLTSDKPIFNENRLGVTNYSGLNLINFFIRPHFNSPFFPKAKESFIVESAKNVTEPIYALDDASAISVDNSTVKVVSAGEWKRFN